MKYNINDLKIIVNDKILDDIRKYENVKLFL